MKRKASSSSVLSAAPRALKRQTRGSALPLEAVDRLVEYDGYHALADLAGDPDSFYIPKYVVQCARFVYDEAADLAVFPKFRGKKMLRAKASFCDFTLEPNGVVTIPEYKYPSSDQVVEHPFPQTLDYLRREVAKRLPFTPNHAIVTFYNGGNVTIGAHSDKDVNFVKGAPIATLSFGAPRVLELTNKTTGKVIRLTLQPRSLYVLSYKLNQEWTHAIPAAPKDCDARSSVVFRALERRVPHPNQADALLLLREDQCRCNVGKCETRVEDCEDNYCPSCNLFTCDQHRAVCGEDRSAGGTLEPEIWECDDCLEKHRCYERVRE